MRSDKGCRLVGLFQGLYYVITGLWPSVAPQSFLAITDTSQPLWAFRSIGLLIFIIGLVILIGALKRDFGRSTTHLAWLSSAALAVIDIGLIYGGQIGRLNLLDILLQATLTVFWLYRVSLRPKLIR